MIQTTVCRKGRITNREYETAEELFGKFLFEEMKVSGADCIIRCKDDHDFFMVAKHLDDRQNEAQRSVTTLAGTSAPYWAVIAKWPDGPGWRIMCSTGVMSSRAQQQAPGQGQQRGAH